MIRLSRTVAMAAVVLALAASGCKKDDDAKGTPGDPKAAQGEPVRVGAAPPGTEKVPPVPGSPEAPKGPQPQAELEKPAVITDEHIKIADGIVEATNEFAAKLDEVKSDCKKATQVVKTTGQKVKTAMSKTDVLQAQLHSDPAAMKWFQQAYGPKMMNALGKLGGVVNACRTDKEFETAFRGLEIGGSPRRPPPGATMPKGPPGSPSGHGALPPTTTGRPPPASKGAAPAAPAAPTPPTAPTPEK